MFAPFHKFLHVVPGRKKRPKLMSLERTIWLSGLLLRDKKLLFGSVPIHCPWLWKIVKEAKEFWRVLLYADAMTGSGIWQMTPMNRLLTTQPIMTGGGKNTKKSLGLAVYHRRIARRWCTNQYPTPVCYNKVVGKYFTLMGTNMSDGIMKFSSTWCLQPDLQSDVHETRH